MHINFSHILLLIIIPCTTYGQIIADHTIVDKFDNIPQYYIDEVKKMYVAFYGESHSGAYDNGMLLLESIDDTYSCNVGTGQTYTDEYLRVQDVGMGVGEDLWFTWYSYPVGSRPNTWLKDMISSYARASRPFNAIGFGWCNDMSSNDYGHSTNPDPVYGVHWYGRSAGGIDGNKYWGIDSDDFSETDNRVSLATYFGAMEEMISYCATNSPRTKMIFTTSPVDITYGGFTGEAGYQTHLKHEAIRAYVKADGTRILFDYADILCWDDDGEATTQTWNGHTYPLITTKNTIPTVDAYHISQAGAIRLAKAQWWMLARIAGWDGGTTDIGKVEIVDEDSIIIQCTGNQLNLKLPKSLQSSKISLYDLTGRKLAAGEVSGQFYNMNISLFYPGIYLIAISKPGFLRTKKIIISQGL